MLVVFDMDGTLLNAQSQLSPRTAEALARLRERGIQYTVATGRTLQAALGPLTGHGFSLPQILKNGAVIWQPGETAYLQQHLVSRSLLDTLLPIFTAVDTTAFVFTLEPNPVHGVYHADLRNDIELRMAAMFEAERELPLRPLSALPDEAEIINISAITTATALAEIRQAVVSLPALVCYSGVAIRDRQLHWLDIHHGHGSKGNAISALRDQLGVSKVMVFGDGDNDLSMFECADEAYAPSNADDAVKALATAVIGHHDEDGIAEFLFERFDLG